MTNSILTVYALNTFIWIHSQFVMIEFGYFVLCSSDIYDILIWSSKSIVVVLVYIVFFSATGDRQGHKRSQDQTGHQCRLPNHTATPQFQIHWHFSGRPRKADRQQLLHLRRRTRDFDIRARWQWYEANQVPRIPVIHGQVRIQWVFHGQFLCCHWDDSEPVWQL